MDCIAQWPAGDLLVIDVGFHMAIGSQRSLCKPQSSCQITFRALLDCVESVHCGS